MILILLCVAVVGAGVFGYLARSRAEAARLQNLDWPRVMTRRQMADRAARYLRLHGWKAIQEDGFADIIMSGPGISIAFLVRPDALLSTDLIDAARERVLGGMPFGLLIGFQAEDWQLADYRSRSILLLHYTELPDFLTIFDATTEALPERLHLYARADQRLSLFMGEKLFRHGRTDAAIEWFENAVDLNPRSAQLSARMLIAALLSQNRSKSAYDVALTAIKWLPDNEHILPSLGDLAMRVGDFAAAESWTQRAIVFDASNADLYRRLAQIEQSLGRHDAAEQALRKAKEFSS